MSMPGMHSGGGNVMQMLNLLPLWLGVAWTAVFLLVAASHLRHMFQTTDERRAWHSCHVLMAIGMAFMYAPGQIDPLAVPAAFWKFVFAGAGIIAAVWAINGIGRVSTMIWFLTSIDMAAMLYMWSSAPHAGTAAVTWILTVYLLAEAAMWTLDLYRRLDHTTPIVSWRLLATETGAPLPTAATRAESSRPLLGELNISASMVAMSVGMAYMLVAMQMMA